jgi:mono/diheme cytochrome c family protein
MKISSLFFLYMMIIMTACENTYTQGGYLFKSQCANCHGENGEGLRNLIPPIAGSDYYIQHHEGVPCLIHNGISGKITVNGKEYSEAMEGIKKLNAIEITNIIHYIDHTWYPNQALPEINVKDVEKILGKCDN